MTPVSVPGILTIIPPSEPKAPVVFDSPHSGTAYPDDFRYACDHHALRDAEDMYVDELFGAAPRHGGVFLRAEFPRSYIDANRTLADIDPALLDQAWPEPLALTEKAAIGKGLIWRLILRDIPIYDRLLSVAEVRARIDRYYRPYHAALDDLIDETVAAFGVAFHVNCHSMPAVVYPVDRPGGVTAADFVLGDRDGTTCEPGFTAMVAETLRGSGASVAINDPYKGVELLRRHGRPAERQHSLQIEINRRLYLDTKDYSRSPGFGSLSEVMDGLIATICRYARDRT